MNKILKEFNELIKNPEKNKEYILHYNGESNVWDIQVKETQNGTIN